MTYFRKTRDGEAGAAGGADPNKFPFWSIVKATAGSESKLAGFSAIIVPELVSGNRKAVEDWISGSIRIRASPGDSGGSLTGKYGGGGTLKVKLSHFC